MKHATLTFRRDSLMYDIDTCAYVEGDIMETDNDHARHQTMDVTQEGNVDRVTRILDLCLAQCVEMLYPYSKHEVHTAEVGVPWRDCLHDRLEYRIDLILPDDYSQSTVNLIEKLVHEYMVCRALADWLEITDTAKAKVWAEKAAAAAAEMQSVKNHRMNRKVRRKLNPF